MLHSPLKRCKRLTGETVGTSPPRSPSFARGQVMNHLKAHLDAQPFAAQNAFHHYADKEHGFAAARADLASAQGRADFQLAHERIAAFFRGVL